MKWTSNLIYLVSCCIVTLSANAQVAISPAQVTTQVSEPQAVLLTNQAQAALTGGVSISDLLLTATGDWILGGTRASGMATLKAKGTTEARMEITAGAFTRSEIRNDANGPDGQQIGPDGVRHQMSFHNCFGPGAWFAPLTILQVTADSSTVVKYVGRRSRNGIAVDHLQFYRTSTEKNPQIAVNFRGLSTVDVYLDAQNHLPVVVVFNIHPDNDAGRDIPVEIRFADYRNLNGVAIPYRIQRLLQGSLNLDITVTSVQVNSGLADSDFTLQ